MSENKNDFMNLNFFVRMFKDGKWQAVNIQNMTEAEFRNFICQKLGLIGLRT